MAERVGHESGRLHVLVREAGDAERAQPEERVCVALGEQYRFLLSAGIIEEIEEIERSAISEAEKLRLRLTIKKLIMPEGGMGDTFKVLVQSRDVAAPRLLCQRRIGG